MADPADNVMMVIFAGIELVAINPVAEVAAPYQVDRFKRRQHPVNRDQIARAFFQPRMHFFSGKRAVFVRQDFENRAPRSGHALAMLTQDFESGVQPAAAPRVQMRVEMRFVGHASAILQQTILCRKFSRHSRRRTDALQTRDLRAACHDVTECLGHVAQHGLRAAADRDREAHPFHAA